VTFETRFFKILEIMSRRLNGHKPLKLIRKALEYNRPNDEFHMPELELQK
jgi:hypothetical protein